jgi:orotidine-5'-phosphate decarboxylase
MRVPTTLSSARGRVIFALDVPSWDDAAPLVADLASRVGLIKVGLELWSREGPDVVRRLVGEGHEVFLDLKLHDIPATVAGAASAAAALGPSLLTVHGPPSSVRAAREAVGDAATRLLGVTVLTSVSAQEYQAYSGLISPDQDPPTLDAEARMTAVVACRAKQLLEAGCDGLVASPNEVAALRQRFQSALLVTPGIRPAGASAHDQARVATPRSAAASGADYLVVGRAIRDSKDPGRAADEIVADALAGFVERSEVAASP